MHQTVWEVELASAFFSCRLCRSIFGSWFFWIHRVPYSERNKRTVWKGLYEKHLQPPTPPCLHPLLPPAASRDLSQPHLSCISPHPAAAPSVLCLFIKIEIGQRCKTFTWNRLLCLSLLLASLLASLPPFARCLLPRWPLTDRLNLSTSCYH